MPIRKHVCNETHRKSCIQWNVAKWNNTHTKGSAHFFWRIPLCAIRWDKEFSVLKFSQQLIVSFKLIFSRFLLFRRIHFSFAVSFHLKPQFNYIIAKPSRTIKIEISNIFQWIGLNSLFVQQCAANAPIFYILHSSFFSFSKKKFCHSSSTLCFGFSYRIETQYHRIHVVQSQRMKKQLSSRSQKWNFYDLI